MISVRNCPHCPATWMNHRTPKGDYYCRACRKRFDPPRTVLEPEKNRSTVRAFAKSRRGVSAIKDHKTHALTPTQKTSLGRQLYDR